MIKLIKNTRGAIALMTMLFIVMVATLLIVFLWSVGIITGSYNVLYIANQNAAVSAISTAKPRSGYSQLAIGNFNGAQTCFGGNTINPIVCPYIPGSNSSDPSVKAAVATMQASLAPRNFPNTDGPFGLNYGDNVHLISDNVALAGLADNIKAINIAEPAGLLRKKAETQPCVPSGTDSDQEVGVLSGYVTEGAQYNAAPHCWMLKEQDFRFPAQFNTVVITRTEAVLDAMPFGCLALLDDLCEPTIVVKAAASQSQPAADLNYDDYYTP